MAMILYNAKVYVEKGNYQEAVLVDDGIIRKVGTSKELLAAAAADDKLYDCEGRTLVPGFNDSHLHFMQYGETLYMPPIGEATSIDEMIEMCKTFVKEHPDRVKYGLHGIGWNQDYFKDEKRIPDRHDLDKISTEFPIVLERVCGHIVSVNTKMIEALGLGIGAPQYPNGEYELEEDGYPNGIFKGNACNYATDVIPDFSMEERKRMAIECMNKVVSMGLTSVQSNDVGTTFMDGPAAFAMFHQIYEEGHGLLRYRHQICFNSIEEFETYLENGEFKHGVYEDGMLTLGPLKLFKDGSLGARTAFMKRPYAGTEDNYGLEWITCDEMDQYCEMAKAHGVQVVTHVIGDQAIEKTIDSYEKAFVDGENKLRHALVHCQITDRKLLDRIRDKGILVAAQPIFIDYDMHVVEDICGKELAETSYNFGTMLREGVHLSYGTDCPVESPDPFENIYEAVTRKDRAGSPEGGFYPEQKVDVETAIDAYTIESAYMEFQEDVKGRIKENYYADMVLMDKDIFTVDPDEIKNIRPVMTMVNGRIVYEA